MSRAHADPSIRMGYLAWQVAHVMGARLERALRSLDLTVAQHNALQQVVWTPGISAAEIARRTGVTPQSMGAAVNALADRGLLARRDHPSNRRTVRLAITESGAILAERARGVVMHIDREALSVLAPDERASVRALLLRLLTELNPDALPSSLSPRSPPCTRPATSRTGAGCRLATVPAADLFPLPDVRRLRDALEEADVSVAKQGGPSAPRPNGWPSSSAGDGPVWFRLAAVENSNRRFEA